VRSGVLSVQVIAGSHVCKSTIAYLKKKILSGAQGSLPFPRRSHPLACDSRRRRAAGGHGRIRLTLFV
jgi:hypothetical protein